MRPLLLVLALIVTIPYVPEAGAQGSSPFADCMRLTGRTATLIIPASASLSLDGEPLLAGDEIAAVTPGGVCTGVASYTPGSALAIAVWEDDPFTEALDGFSHGEALAFHIYRKTTGVRGHVSGMSSRVTYDPSFHTSGEFMPDGVIVVTTLPMLSGSSGLEEVQPLAFGLNGAYPNPFSEKTTLAYSLPAATEVRLEVFDLLGRRVSTLVEGVQGAGRYEVTFDPSVLSERLATGVYIGRLHAFNQVSTVRMTLLQ